MGGYHSTSSNLEKNASNNWTHQMCNPIENTSQEGYVSSYESTKCDCRVDMTPINVRSHSNRHKSPYAWDNDATKRPPGVAGPLPISLPATVPNNLSPNMP